MFAPRLEDLPVEEFHVAVLDAQHRLERDITVTRGILNSSLVHPREVFREAIAERAAAVILVHNHPSGDPTPSADDRIVTEQLVAAGQAARHSGARSRDHRTGAVHELRGGGTVVTATSRCARSFRDGARTSCRSTTSSTASCSCAPIGSARRRTAGRRATPASRTSRTRVEVAKILADLQLDSVTVASGLIHDVVEDTQLTLADVEREFGKEIAAIVDGLTKIAKLPTGGSTQERQVESYRKLLLSIAKDARVIIVKLADRLHNMRTLECLPAGEAPPHRAGDARPLRAARAPLRYGEAAVGARGPRVQAPRDRRVQGAREEGRAEARRARGARSRSWREPLDRAARRRPASRTSTSPVGRSTSGRSTRR